MVKNEQALNKGQLTVAAVQMEFDSAEPFKSRVSRLERLVSDVEDADLIVLPELWLHGGFSYETWRADAISLDSDVLVRLSALAKHKKAWLHAGSYIEAGQGDAAGSMWNTSVLYNAAGAVHATYRKIHRFGFSDGEPKLIAAGDQPVVVEIQVGDARAATGLSTCYDLRFPELYRHLSAEGTALNLIPACWPMSRVEHWKVLGQARAIENQSFVIQCNMTGVDQGIELGGNSQIIDGNGDILARAGREETVISASLDLDALRKFRHSFPVLTDQRADIWDIQGKDLRERRLSTLAKASYGR